MLTHLPLPITSSDASPVPVPPSRKTDQETDGHSGRADARSMPGGSPKPTGPFRPKTDIDALDTSGFENTTAAKDQQVELFETAPPPWELAAARDVAVAKIVFSEAPTDRTTISSRTKCGTQCRQGCGSEFPWDVAKN